MVRIISLAIFIAMSGTVLAAETSAEKAQDLTQAQDLTKAQDPTMPLTFSSGSIVGKQDYFPSLQSILCSDGGSCKAIIDSEILIAGQSINDYRVRAINSEKVVLTKDSKTWSLELFTQIKH